MAIEKARIAVCEYFECDSTLVHVKDAFLPGWEWWHVDHVTNTRTTQQWPLLLLCPKCIASIPLVK